MSNSLFQKYRPIKWSQVVGHEKVVLDLQTRSKERNFPQALYFSGISGTGKTTIAKLVALSAKCTSLSPDGEPCGQCVYCKDIIDEKNVLDNYFYNATDLGIDEMRNLEEICNSNSLISRKKIIFMDEFHTLSPGSKAYNFCLTLIEKKREDVIFIIGTMEDHRVSEAIKNRTVRFNLKPISFESISNYLFHICQMENVTLDEKKLDCLTAIADNCNGSARTAVSMLERAIFGDLWDEQELLKEVGVVPQERLLDIIGSLLEGKVDILENVIINPEMLDSIKRRLFLAYKKSIGIDIGYQTKEVGSLPKLGTMKIEKMLDTIFELQKFPYLTSDLITYRLAQTSYHLKDLNQKNLLVESHDTSTVIKEPLSTESKENSPVRRRVNALTQEGIQTSLSQSSIEHELQTSNSSFVRNAPPIRRRSLV